MKSKSKKIIPKAVILAKQKRIKKLFYENNRRYRY